MKSRGFLFVFLAATGIGWGADLERRSAGAAAAAGWEMLDKGLSDSSETHRQQAVLAAGSIGATSEAVKFIGGALQDKSTLVRSTAATVLGQLKSPDGIPYLKRALGDNVEVSFSAAKALMEMDDPDGREVLQEVLVGDRKDKPGFLQQGLKKAKKKITNPAELALMGVKESAGVLVGPASMGIVAAEKAGMLGAEAAVKSGGKGAVSGRAIAVAMLVDHPDNYTRILLEWALTDSDTAVRASAARGLGKCGNDESVPKLQTALTDAHAAVRFMAAASLIRISK